MSDETAAVAASAAHLGLFVDLENLSVSGERGLIEIDAPKLVEALEGEGTVTVRRAYADWARLTAYREGFLGAGFEQVQASHVNRWKNDLDMVMALDVLEVALANPTLTTIALATSDVDFAPLVRVLRRHGRKVLGIGWGHKVSRRFRDDVDGFVDLETVLGKPRPLPRGSGRRPDHRGDGAREPEGRAIIGPPRRSPAAERTAPEPALSPDELTEVLADLLLSNRPEAPVPIGALRESARRRFPDRPPRHWARAGIMAALDASPLVVDLGGGRLLLPKAIDLTALNPVGSEQLGDLLQERVRGWGGLQHSVLLEGLHAVLSEAPADRTTLIDAVIDDIKQSDETNLPSDDILSERIDGMIDSWGYGGIIETSAAGFALCADFEEFEVVQYESDSDLIRRAMRYGLVTDASGWATLLDGDGEYAQDFADMLLDLGLADPKFHADKVAPADAGAAPKQRRRASAGAGPFGTAPNSDADDDSGVEFGFRLPGV